MFPFLGGIEGACQAKGPLSVRRVKDVDISPAEGWIEVASIVHPPGEVVVSMRPVSVFAKRSRQ
jgi:hypothetical protein